MDDVARAKATRAKSKLMENFESQEALDKAVSEYIRPMHRFRRLAPAVCASQLKQEGAESFSKSLHDYLSPQRCLFVKQQTNLSKDQWHKVRNLLTKRYDTDTARHLPLILDGTLVHPLPGVWRLDKERDLQLEGLTVRESDDGAFAAVVVADKMRLDILNHLNLGHLRRENGVIVGSDGQHPVVCWSFDACGIFNGMKQTSFGYKICNLINCVENSPKYFHEFALMECGDDHAQIVTHAQSTMDEVNVIIDAKRASLIFQSSTLVAQTKPRSIPILEKEGAIRVSLVRTARCPRQKYRAPTKKSWKKVGMREPCRTVLSWPTPCSAAHALAARWKLFLETTKLMENCTSTTERRNVQSPSCWTSHPQRPSCTEAYPTLSHTTTRSQASLQSSSSPQSSGASASCTCISESSTISLNAQFFTIQLLASNRRAQMTNKVLHTKYGQCSPQQALGAS